MIVKLQPLLAVWADESVVVAPVHASVVHEHAVQLEQISDGLVRLLCQKFAEPMIQVQLLWEDISLVDLQARLDSDWLWSPVTQ